MKKINSRFLVWFAAVAVAVFAVALVLKGRPVIAPGGDATNITSSSVSTAPLPDGDEVVSAAAADYYFSMPSNWYLEKKAGTGVTIYPDYDPNSGSAPECKIELSTLAGGGDLDTWITKYLHADPTANVAEISRTPVAIGTSSAIEWRGTLNSVTTTLVYVVMPDDGSGGGGGGNILEIAPSTLSEASDADNDECGFDLQALVANLKFGAYEP